jgi:hypothetical protein
MHPRCWHLIGRQWALYVVHDQSRDRLEIGQLGQAALLALRPFSAPGVFVHRRTPGEGCFVQTWCGFVWTLHTRRFGWCCGTASKSDEWHRTYYAGFDKVRKQERPGSWLLRFDLVWLTALVQGWRERVRFAGQSGTGLLDRSRR